MEHAQLILTLQQVKGCNGKSMSNLVDYIKHNDMAFTKASTVVNLLDKARKNGLLKRFKVEDYAPELIEDYMTKAQSILDKCKALDIKVITSLNTHYPKVLWSACNDNGESAIPHLVYYKGNLEQLNVPSICIISSSTPSSEGLTAASYVAGQFAMRGFNIVSGLALGCDSAAHQGALKVKGRTTAVLGCGLDVIHPKENESLAQEILEKNGLLISEYAPGFEATKETLAARDYLQAATSRATIVVQSTLNGGTMNAAHATCAAKKALYAITYKNSAVQELDVYAGNRELINSDKATPISGREDWEALGRELWFNKS